MVTEKIIHNVLLNKDIKGEQSENPLYCPIHSFTTDVTRVAL